MARRCTKCGAEIHPGSTICRSCLAPVEREGFFARLARVFGSQRAPSTPQPGHRSGFQIKFERAPSTPQPGRSSGFQVTVKTNIRIRDAKTGEMREYGSLDEVPAEYREKIEQAQQAAANGAGGKSFTVTKSSGEVQTYRSLEEMPPDVRAIYERAIKDRK